MTTPINLNKARKAKGRKEARKRADENAVKFGRSKSEKQREKAKADKAARFIDAHKRDS